MGGFFCFKLRVSRNLKNKITAIYFYLYLLFKLPNLQCNDQELLFLFFVNYDINVV